MFISKQEIKQALKDEGVWEKLTPSNRKFFLEYCINGHDPLKAFIDTIGDDQSSRVIKEPGVKANEIVAKPEFRECFEVYVDLLKEIAGVKTNSSIFNIYQAMSFFNPLDYLDNNGEFKFDDIEQAKEQLGIKAMAIKSIDLSVHPRDPKAVIRTVTFVDRFKSLKELQKFSEFIENTESGGAGVGNLIINTSLAEVSVDNDVANRKRLGFEEEVS